MRAYYAANPHIVIRNTLAQRVKRRSHELNFIDGAFLQSLYKAQRGRCLYCGERVGRSYRRPHIDHFVPLARGGDNDRTNLCIACAECNQAKHAKMPWEWMPDRFPPPDTQLGE